MDKEDNLVFYHGGVTSDFEINQIDLFRVADKQQKSENKNVGFYMYDTNARKNAFDYAINANKHNNTFDKGVVKITLSKDVKIYNIDSFGAITRQTKEDLENIQKDGYDLIKGKMFPKDEYILLNKSKIKSIEFESIVKEILNQRKQILLLINMYDRNDGKTNKEISKVEKALNLLISMEQEINFIYIYEKQKDLIAWLKSRKGFLIRKDEEYDNISKQIKL